MRSTRPMVKAALLLVLTACGAGLQPPSGIPGAPAAPVAVERFLQLAADRDYAGMGWYFGTSEGPVMQRDPVSQVERRMYGLASLLENDSFIVGNGLPVPGRTGEAIRFNVILTRRGRTLAVPFTTVRGPDERWYVEQLDVEAITAP
ncbi:MAG: hypothetical protein WD766_10805 [Gemmatimonadota bacterium]